MKNFIVVSALMLFYSSSLLAQKMEHEQRKSPHVTIAKKHVTITYGRPFKKNREIFGSLVPFDQVWRTGADEATEITVDRDCIFAGQSLKAGTYVMYTIPEQKEWTIILNSELAEWGAYEYDQVKDKNVLLAKVGARHLNKPVEQFTINIKKNDFTMEWDHTKVTVPVRFN